MATGGVARLDRDDVVYLGYALDESKGRVPLGILASEVFLGHPTGDRATLSHIDGDSALDHIGEKDCDRRPAHGLDVVGHRVLHEHDGVP